MRAVWLLTLALAGACGAGQPAPGRSLAPDRVAAIQDSVRSFLAAFATDVSHPPVGKKARDALAPFYDPAVVVSTDLAPGEPVLIQTFDTLVPPDEVVTVPAWIDSTRFEWGTLVIVPLAPGLAAFTGKYAEHVTDTAGVTTELPGVQQGVVRHGENGWRFLTLQSSHPAGTHQRQAALAARVTPVK
jgi:hypothetical protein